MKAKYAAAAERDDQAPAPVWLERADGRLPSMAKRATVSIEDVIAAIETARDKVMADEVKSLVKLGLPKNVATKMVNERYRQRSEGDEAGEGEGSPWLDMS